MSILGQEKPSRREILVCLMIFCTSITLSWKDLPFLIHIWSIFPSSKRSVMSRISSNIGKSLISKLKLIK